MNLANQNHACTAEYLNILITSLEYLLHFKSLKHQSIASYYAYQSFIVQGMCFILLIVTTFNCEMNG